MSDKITILGVRVHNLKNISLVIPKNKLVVITGLSGSGKSSLAFDTLYAEGQRRYAESLSSYARQFLNLQDKPDVDQIEGLSPTIAISQKNISWNPRSTVGTMTEIYDYLRLLFARAGQAHCPQCNRELSKQNLDQILKTVLGFCSKEKIIILAPILCQQKGELRPILEEVQKAGYEKIRIDGIFYETKNALCLVIDRNKKHDVEVVMDDLQITNYELQKTEKQKNKKIDESNVRLKNSLKKTLEMGDGLIIIHSIDKKKDLFLGEHLFCSNCHFDLPDLEPRSFSFNSPFGACPACKGIGTKLVMDPELVIPNPRLTLAQGAVRPWVKIFTNQTKIYQLLGKVAEKYGFSLDTPVGELTKKQREVLLYGEEISNIKCQDYFPGTLVELEKYYQETKSDYLRKELEKYMRVEVCPDCGGKRLRPESLAVTVFGKSIAKMTGMSVEKISQFFDSLLKTNHQKDKLINPVLKEIQKRLGYLKGVGLEYLTLDRSAATLAGGEAQRIKLATQLGANLSGLIYILDEPTIGLHARDIEKFIKTLKELKNLGNSIIIVEHDEQVILAADWVIDLGPGAGKYGGEVVAQGTPEQIIKNEKSLTGQYLNRKSKIKNLARARLKEEQKLKIKNRKDRKLIIKGASEFNLKNIDVEIPLGKFTCITGVSGSGKSTLMVDILAKALAKKFYGAKDRPGQHKAILGLNYIDKVINVDQSPIGRTPRSNPATYIGLFTCIRDLFTQIPEAKIRGYKAGQFSFNIKDGGRCSACQGEGAMKIEMQFLPNVYVECQECHGSRYNQKTLEIYYYGKNIAQVLNMSVEEAMNFFQDIPVIHEKLKILWEVGLGYLQLGQPATTLSGGEAQRIKLATELGKRSTGKTLYILDEPTTGLHFEDIKKLLQVLKKLIEKGNTVLVVEHNLEVIKQADWIIDLGPEGGDKGGYLVIAGPLENVAKSNKGYTGRYLRGVKR